MNSVAAVLRTPALALESMAPMPSPEQLEDEPYPWAAYTPEASPRYWVAAYTPPPSPDVAVNPMPSLEWLRMMCEPCFEQVSCVARQISEKTTVSRELLRTMCEPCFQQKIMELQQVSMAPYELLRAMCEPFFEEMITASQLLRAMSEPFSEEMITASQQQKLQRHTLQQQYNNQCQSMQIMSATGMCYQPVSYPHMMKLRGVDEASTEAADSSGLSSEDGEPTNIVEKGSLVCRHWQSKGWCRLESKCKFLHPEHKCGISAPKGLSGSRIHAAGTIGTLSLVDPDSEEGAVPAVAAARFRKRKNKNKSSRRNEDQLANV